MAEPSGASTPTLPGLEPCPVAFCRGLANHRTLHDIPACTPGCGPIVDGKPRAWHAADCLNGAWLRARKPETEARGG